MDPYRRFKESGGGFEGAHAAVMQLVNIVFALRGLAETK